MHSAPAEQSTPSRAAIFWRYWTGSTISGLGTAVTSVALPLAALLVAHASTFAVATIGAAGSLPWLLLGLPAGVLVSRLPLRGTQVAMDLARAAAIASIPVAAWAGDLTVAQLLVVGFVVGACSVIFGVANSTMIPAIVPRDELARRNSLVYASGGAAQLAGPSLGGVVVQLIGAASCMLIDAVSFLVSAVMLWTLPRPEPAPRQLWTGLTGAREELLDGVRFVRDEPVLRATFWLTACVNLIGAAILALAPIFVVKTLHERSFVLGLVYAAEGAGALLGAAVTPRLSARWGSARVLIGSVLPLPLTVVLLPLAFRGAGACLFGLGVFSFAATLTVAGITITTHRHQSVPAGMLPRLMATTRMVSWGGAPLGALLAGSVASLIGARGALFVIAATGLSGPLCVCLSPAIRGRRRLEDA